MRTSSSVPDPNFLPSALVSNLNTDVTGLTLQHPTAGLGFEPVRALIIAGQSLMANNVQGTYSPGSSVHNFNFANGGLYSCGNKLLGCTSHATNFSNMATRLADKLNTTFPTFFGTVILAPMAINGTAISVWAGDPTDVITNPTGVDLRPMIRVMASRILTYFTPTAVLFGQGTTDNQAVDTSQATYQARYTTVINTFRSAGLTCPFLIALESWDGTNTAAGIRAGQAALVDHGANIFQGADHDTLDNTKRWDTLHFTAAGADEQATLWYNAIVTALAL